MKQVIQNYRTGDLELAEVPIPLCSSDAILVRNVASLVSTGTERTIIELGQKSLLGKAKERPDLVRRFLDKAKKEGLLKTFQEALNILDNPNPIGYSSAGAVIEIGANIHKFSPGDRVSCIGAGYASHAEYVRVPENLCCKIPDSLSFEEASFGMLGIVALHGIRCAKLTFGETVAVIGLGLLGLLTIQILKAYGCTVIGTDIDPNKMELASKLGADVLAGVQDFKKGCELFSGGYGVDAAILTVATKSDEPVNTAVDIVRYGGRIVIVGVTDIHPQRNEMWHKEVEIIVSKAGGPGTFDPFYESKGIDYPIGFVRWTENRNLEEFLRLVAQNKVNVRSLISHRFKIEEAEKVYRDIIDNRGGPYIGVVFEYPQEGDRIQVIGHRIRALKSITDRPSSPPSTVSLGVIGAGHFGKALLLPALKRITHVHFNTLSTSSSANAYHTAKKYAFEKCTTDYHEVLENQDIDAVVILTPHSAHGKMVTEALQAGKHVFVEKPLCINEKELREIITVYHSALGTQNSALVLMVGYNRRYSPHAAKIIEVLSNRQEPMVINYRVNAGFVPADHWVHSEEEGGSRIIGEVCHFVDFMQFLTKGNPVRVFAERVSGNNRSTLNSDNVVIALKFEDGSVGNIIYSGSGNKAFSREQVEIFCEGTTVVSTDFKKTSFYKDSKSRTYKTMNQQMGYKEELAHFFDVISGKISPCVSYNEIFFSTQAVFSINSSLEKNSPVAVIVPL
jgi:predicted dehydrogenase/threonine dehydrogenase-like Zn-dependent dehydrogenase